MKILPKRSRETVPLIVRVKSVHTYRYDPQRGVNGDSTCFVKLSQSQCIFANEKRGEVITKSSKQQTFIQNPRWPPYVKGANAYLIEELCWHILPIAVAAAAAVDAVKAVDAAVAGGQTSAASAPKDPPD